MNFSQWMKQTWAGQTVHIKIVGLDVVENGMSKVVWDVYLFDDWATFKAPFGRFTTLYAAYMFARRAGYPPGSMEIAPCWPGDGLVTQRVRLFAKTLPTFESEFKAWLSVQWKYVKE